MNAFISYYKMNLKVVLQYRWGLLVSLFIDPFIVLINISLFSSIYAYNQANYIAGYELAQMIWYFAGTNFVWYFTYNFADHELSRGILTGDLSMQLLKPVSISSFLLGQAAALRTMGVIFEFIPNILVYSLLCRPTFMTAGSLIRFLVCIILSFFLMFLINFLIGLSAFKIKNNFSIINLKTILIGLLGGGYFPLDFYPEWLMNILNYLPFKYVFYMPLQFLLNKEGTQTLQEFGKIIGIQLMWLIILGLLCKILWRQAIKKFCAVGG